MFHSPAEPRPTRQLPLPTSPSHPKFGFVLRDSFRHTPAAGPNWVRFARFTPRPGRSPHGDSLCPYPLVPPKFGFVLHDFLCQHTPAGARLGSFCTIWPVRSDPVGRSPPPTPCPPGRNWVCFSEATGQQYVHNIITEPGLSSFCHFANWVRFAHLPSGARPRRAKLGSFCAFCLRHTPAGK
jgi:hypothetical protein